MVNALSLHTANLPPFAREVARWRAKAFIHSEQVHGDPCILCCWWLGGASAIPSIPDGCFLGDPCGGVSRGK